MMIELKTFDLCSKRFEKFLCESDFEKQMNYKRFEMVLRHVYKRKEHSKRGT